MILEIRILNIFELELSRYIFPAFAIFMANNHV